MTWVFVGLFLLFGVLMLMTESAFWRHFLAGLSVLSLGGFAVAMVKDALTTGQIRIQYSVIHYATQPRLFWTAIILVAAAGMIVLVGGVWILCFEN